MKERLSFLDHEGADQSDSSNDDHDYEKVDEESFLRGDAAANGKEMVREGGVPSQAR